ncbi:MAG: hypothetical protein AB1813_06500 [Verrucomicrobiota bacterium]
MPPRSKRGAGQPDAFGVRRQNEVTTALWPRLDARRTASARRIGQSGAALTLCHRTPKEAPGQSDAFGVRRQNEVTTALWPRLHAPRTSNARRIGQSGVALTLCRRTPKWAPVNPMLLDGR